MKLEMAIDVGCFKQATKPYPLGVCCAEKLEPDFHQKGFKFGEARGFVVLVA